MSATTTHPLTELAVRRAKDLVDITPPTTTQLRNWLLAQPESRTFSAHHPSYCPLASWYADRGIDVQVAYSTIIRTHEGGRDLYPIHGTWLESIQMAWVDMAVTKIQAERTFDVHLTRDEVLEVLDRQMGYA